jgi:hypothetical protein
VNNPASKASKAKAKQKQESKESNKYLKCPDGWPDSALLNTTVEERRRRCEALIADEEIRSLISAAFIQYNIYIQSREKEADEFFLIQ